MKTLLSICLGVWLTLFGLHSVSTAELVNGSFESMNFYGWTFTLGQGTSANEPFNRTAGAGRSVASWSEPAGMIPMKMPGAGHRFAALQTRPSANFIGNGTYDISLSQVVQLNQGDTLSGWSSFYNGDLQPQDSAWVRILDQAGNQIAAPWQANSGSPGPANPNATLLLTTTDWTRWEWQAPDTGSYSILLGMTTGGNNNSASYGFFDDLFVQPAISVPEPSSLALAVTGTILFAALRRRKS